MFMFLWKKQNGAKNTARTMFCFRYNITENCKIEKIKFKKKKKITVCHVTTVAIWRKGNLACLEITMALRCQCFLLHFRVSFLFQCFLPICPDNLGM